MSQADVLKLLKKKRRWMTEREIAKLLKINQASHSLKQLLKYHEVERKTDRYNQGTTFRYIWRAV